MTQNKRPVHTTLHAQTHRELLAYSKNGTLNSAIETVVELVNRNERLHKSDKIFLNDIADSIVAKGGHEYSENVQRLRHIANYGIQGAQKQ